MSFYTDFKAKYLGKSVDVDNYPIGQKYQCYDLASVYIEECGGPEIHCTTTGYVKDIWTNRKTNGILDAFDEVVFMQPGDLVIFKPQGETPYSHIAIFDSDIDGTKGWFLGQNQPYPYVNLKTLKYSDTYTTAFRPKKTGVKTLNVKTGESETVNGVQVTLERGMVEFTKDNILVRDGTPTGKVVAKYNAGDTVNYWGKYVGNGHRYVVYTSYNGNIRFVAVSGSETYGVDKWAEVI